MLTTPDSALRTIEVLLSIALILQSLEFLSLQKELGPLGRFPWGIARGDFRRFPKMVIGAFDFLYRPPVFLNILRLRILVCAIVLLPLGGSFFLAGSQLLLSLVILWRWRGAFNGGSDFLGLIMLLVIALARLFPNQPLVLLGGLWYISVQLCLSYFVAGWVKVIRPDWRSGAALEGFFKTSIYEKPSRLVYLLSGRSRFFYATWLILGFELLFPLSLVHVNVSIVFILLGGLFHLANVEIFGLNRFFWIWLSAYPALYFCSQLGLVVGSR